MDKGYDQLKYGHLSLKVQGSKVHSKRGSYSSINIPNSSPLKLGKMCDSKTSYVLSGCRGPSPGGRPCTYCLKWSSKHLGR